MIIVFFAEMFYQIFDLLLGWLKLPALPDDVSAIADYIEMVLQNGVGLVLFFIPKSTITTSLNIILLIEASITIYYLVMWILKKIPMVGIN